MLAPEIKFFLSPASMNLLGADSASQHSNIVKTINLSDKFIFITYEVTDWTLIKTNVPGRYRIIWSYVNEVNYDFYAAWSGHYKVLEISINEPELSPLISNVILAKSSFH